MGNITLHFPDNFGGDTTQIHYIGLKGEATQVSWVEPWSYFILFVSFGQESCCRIVLKINTLLYINLQLKRDVVATIVYELMPNPSDHKWVPCFIFNLFFPLLGIVSLTCWSITGSCFRMRFFCVYGILNFPYYKEYNTSSIFFYLSVTRNKKYKN